MILARQTARDTGECTLHDVRRRIARKQDQNEDDFRKTVVDRLEDISARLDELIARSPSTSVTSTPSKRRSADVDL